MAPIRILPSTVAATRGCSLFIPFFQPPPPPPSHQSHSCLLAGANAWSSQNLLTPFSMPSSRTQSERSTTSSRLVKFSSLTSTNIYLNLSLTSPLLTRRASSRAYAARMSFYRLKQFQCEVTGKSGLDYFQALESEQQEAKTLHARFPEPLKPAILKSVQWRSSQISFRGVHVSH
jgi:hypothetical protein